MDSQSPFEEKKKELEESGFSVFRIHYKDSHQNSMVLAQNQKYRLME